MKTLVILLVGVFLLVGVAFGYQRWDDNRARSRCERAGGKWFESSGCLNFGP